jgi:hypothetical protein
MIFIRANATAPDTRLNADVHRRAAVIARLAISNPQRFANYADLNCSTETLNDDFVEMEFINSSANPWAARYSPYIGTGFVNIASLLPLPISSISTFSP